MILGVYWYFKFPEDLYQFKFFTFFRGVGGHANNLAELEARIQVDAIENVLKEIESIKSRFKEPFLIVKVNENQLLINTGDYTLRDYHFEMITEIDQLLQKENAFSIDNKTRFEAKSSFNFNMNSDVRFDTIEYRFIQLIGSEIKKDNAENSSLRIDCNLPLFHKKEFIDTIKKICLEENIHVFYYNDFDFNIHSNLMMFFTNGRQKNDTIQNVVLNSFGSKIQNITEQYQIEFGHKNGFSHHPLNDPHTELMVDKEYIINEIKN